ncbi:MAG: 16S rRNA (cytosine(1402)-N(4))-methyltransferase RsmH [Candidatus Harrisonbacteria bacterium]|nr:16S rRNA (cytosine(1402)-N(4))-methyltransferase RsmH [Candidatus Harrisonbacteria bacterium]
MKETIHVPVLMEEVLYYLDPKEGEVMIDGTYGGGGHAKEIQARLGEAGKLVACDLNPEAVALCRGNLPKTICIEGSFSEVASILTELSIPKVDGLLLDLGFSTDEMENSGRGFSFLRDEPLLMTYSDREMPVYEILRNLKEEELADIIYEYGEERYSRKIARAIKEEGKKQSILSSLQLAEIIRKAVGSGYERGRIHPATRTFQALRIYANKELYRLTTLLNALPTIMNPGGRVVIISFHSLEDRIVKNHFRDFGKKFSATILTKKPIEATEVEIFKNPKARSAKLRAIRF